MTNSIHGREHRFLANAGRPGSGTAFRTRTFPRFVVSTQQFGAGECLVTLPTPDTTRCLRSPTPDFSHSPTTEGRPDRRPQREQSRGHGGRQRLPDICPATDQRGAVRPAGRCDIGAYQRTTPLPGVAGPVGSIAAFDGTSLYHQAEMPRPVQAEVPIVRGRRHQPAGRAMTTPKAVVTRSGRWVLRLTVRPGFRTRSRQ